MTTSSESVQSDLSIQVSIPTILRALTNEQKHVLASGANVREVIEFIEQRHPGVQALLLADDKVHRFVNIYVNDQDIRFGDGLATPVCAGDAITILPAVAGGASRMGAA